MVKGTLEVLLVEGRDIKDPETFLDCLCFLKPCNQSKLRLYVMIQCGIQVLTSDVAHQEGNKLIWNEKLILNLEYPEGEDKAYNKLVFRIMDKHNVSEDNYIGEATIYIKDVVSLGTEKGKAELRTQKYRVVLPDNTYSGEISVAVSFTLDV